MYNNIYNFIYQMEGFSLEKKELDTEEFIKILNIIMKNFFILLILMKIQID